MKGNTVGKIWINPAIEICFLHGYTNKEEKNIREIIKDNLEKLNTKWYEYFEK